MKNSKWILCLLFILLGCAGPKKQLKEVEIPEISFPKIEAPKEGCIWTPHSKALFSDPIARNIGDTVTVNIVETSKASNKATTNADRIFCPIIPFFLVILLIAKFLILEEV